MKIDDYQIDQVYYVKQKQEIAIRPHIIGDSIEWGNTSRGNYIDFSEVVFDGKNIKNLETPFYPKHIDITSKDGHKYTLEVLTNEIFKQIKNQLAGDLHFNSDEDLRKYFLDTNFESY